MSDREQHHEPSEQPQGKQMPAAFGTYLKIKDAIKGPELLRDEDGLASKRLTKTYLVDTCPFCETTAEHQGQKYRFSKHTKRKIATNVLGMLAVAIATGIGLLHYLVGGALILLLGFTTSTHTERKMFYSLMCRNCGAHFPMDEEKKEKIRQEQREKKQAEAGAGEVANDGQTEPLDEEQVDPNESQDEEQVDPNESQGGEQSEQDEE